jgi:hypothetical protein
MVSSVTTLGSGSTPAVAAEKPRPVNLDADLAKAEGQLADWVACPSRKTPEGKAKIEEISAKVDTIKAKLKSADESRPTGTDATRSTGSAISTLGGVVDAYA